MTVPLVVRDAPIDWVKFDAELARDGTVDPVDKALYAALASFVPGEGHQQRITNPDSDDAPTRRVLAACIGRSVDTVDRATKRLEDRGLLEVERRRDPDNPRSNIPSVYRLLDHEKWDERAAARAAARKAQREREKAERQAAAEARRKAAEEQKQAEKEADLAAQARRGWPQGCGEGGRTDAATPGRTSAAVPLPSKNFSLSEESPQVADTSGPVEEDERETTAAPNHHAAATAVAKAWSAARAGLPNPGIEDKVRLSAARLLLRGWSSDLATQLAEDMARRFPTYHDLDIHALHWAPTSAADALPKPVGADVPLWCGRCGDVDDPENAPARHNPRFRTIEDPATGAVRPCVDCHPSAAAAA